MVITKLTYKILSTKMITVYFVVKVPSQYGSANSHGIFEDSISKIINHSLSLQFFFKQLFYINIGVGPLQSDQLKSSCSMGSKASLYVPQPPFTAFLMTTVLRDKS